VAKETLLDQIVANVNGEVILASELDKQKTNVSNLLKLENRSQELDQPMQFQKKVLEQMIEDRLINNEIKKYGIQASDAQVQNVIENIMRENGIGTKAEFERLLKTEGTTLGDLESDYKKRISSNNYMSQIIQPKINISDADIEKKIHDLQGQKSQPVPYVEFAMFFIPQDDNEMSSIQDISNKLQNSQNFEDLAKAQSKGPNAEQGGYMGKVPETDLQPQIAQALKMLSKDEVSKPIPMELGTAWVKHLGKGNMSLEISKEDFAKHKEIIMNQRIAQALNQDILRLKQSAIIETFL